MIQYILWDWIYSSELVTDCSRHILQYLQHIWQNWDILTTSLPHTPPFGLYSDHQNWHFSLDGLNTLSFYHCYNNMEFSSLVSFVQAAVCFLHVRFGLMTDVFIPTFPTCSHNPVMFIVIWNHQNTLSISFQFILSSMTTIWCGKGGLFTNDRFVPNVVYDSLMYGRS